MKENACDRDSTNLAALDRHLARCVAASMRSHAAPDWPGDINLAAADIAKRVSFHGIALLLLEYPGTLSTWPDAALQQIREEARNQSFWETSHRETVGGLLEAFFGSGIEATVIKGTALAYSVYANPAVRRRGDSDILIVRGSRNEARTVLRDCGFESCHDERPLQESWQIKGPPNFWHHVDLHWRINASAAISQQLEAFSPFASTVALDRLSPHARGVAPVDNLLLICINRTAHDALGYRLGEENLFEGDRLIWAADIDLIARSLGPEEWDQLIERARLSGTSRLIASGLTFARRVCGTAIPQAVIDRLDKAHYEIDLATLLDPQLWQRRFWLDLAASPTLIDRARLLRYTLFPAPQFLHERFPDGPNWPNEVLGIRRLAFGLGKLIRGKS